MPERLGPITAWLTTSGIRILGIVVAVLALSQMSRWITGWVEKCIPEYDLVQAAETRKRAHTLGNILRHTLLIVLCVVAILMILGELGIELGPLLAAAGIGALAFGLGAQGLVKDVINGFFIILENQYRIGDVIEVTGVSGLVESVNLRKTVLRDLEGKVHTVPNGEIKIVSNLSKAWSRSVLDVPISYREDADRVIGLLNEIGGQLSQEEPLKSAILEPLQVLGIERFGESQMTVRLLVKTVPLRQWDVARELRKRIKKRFDEQGIEMPSQSLVISADRATASHALKRGGSQEQGSS